MSVFIVNQNCKGKFLKRLYDQFKGYSLKTLNLNEFIRFNELDMILNNDIIDTLDFEIFNYNKMLEAAAADIAADNPNATAEEIEQEAADYIFDMEIYQYFIISEYDALNYWSKYTDYPIYYNECVNMWLVGITHFGMSWDFFNTSYQIREYF